MEQRNTLTANERLKLKSDINTLFSSGRWLRSEHIRLVYLVTESTNLPPCRVMFSASKKNHRRAVKRNLLKRRMRESYRLNKNDFYTNIQDFGVSLQCGLLYSSDVIVDYQLINREIKKLLAQLVLRANKKLF